MIKQLPDSFQYLLQLLSRYKAIAIIILLLLVLSFVLALISPSSIKLQIFNTIFKDFVDKSLTNNQGLFPFILMNNLRVLFLSLGLSFTVIVPLFLFIYNGYFLGFFFDSTDRIFGLSTLNRPNPTLPFFLVSVLPHGVIEISTFFLSCFLSFLLGLKLILGKRIEPQLKRRQFIFRVVKIYLYILVPLIIIAAAIESTLSAKLADIASQEIATSQSDSILPDNFVLQPADLKSLGLQVTISDQTQTTSSLIVPWQNIGIYLYADSYYNKLINNKPDSYIFKNYLINKKTSLTIKVFRFDSPAQAENYLKLAQTIFSQQSASFKLEKVGPNLYRGSTPGPLLLDLNSEKEFVYSINYNGDDQSLIKQLDHLQSEKLSQLKSG